MVIGERVLQEESSTIDIFILYRLIFAEDVRFKIIDVLAKREGANLREIARSVGMSRKNVASYLENMVKKGVINVFPLRLGTEIYRLTPIYEPIKKIHRQYIF
jgi:predicted transcriptional regulator